FRFCLRQTVHLQRILCIVFISISKFWMATLVEPSPSDLGQGPKPVPAMQPSEPSSIASGPVPNANTPNKSQTPPVCSTPLVNSDDSMLIGASLRLSSQT